jgi:hypothetical protein
LIENSSYTWRLVNGDGGTYPTSTFNVANNAGTSVATFLDNGNVGIGTTAPSDKLEIKDGAIKIIGSTSTFDAYLKLGNSNNINILGTHLWHDSGGTEITKLDSVWDSASSGGIQLRVRTAGTPIVGLAINSSGNVGIGTTAPVASAKLQVESTTQGFLPPRMTNAQRLAIASPAVGLMVYCTDVVEGLYINKSTGWTYIG